MKKKKQTQRQFELAHMRAVETFSDHYRIEREKRERVLLESNGQSALYAAVAGTMSLDEARKHVPGELIVCHDAPR